jgi:tetratricopeptide (TPR) repeat protein
MISKTPTSAAGWLDAGLAHAKSCDFAAAIAAFTAGLALTEAAGDDALADEVTQLHFRLANAAMEIGDLDLAEQHYKMALRIDVNLVYCWCNLGNVFQRKNRPADAIPYYSQALNLDATHLPTRLNLANALIAMQQWLVAKALLAELCAERPADAQVRNLLGRVNVGLENFAAAAKDFEAAIALDPADSDSIYWLASVRQTIGEDEAAGAAYAEALRLKPLIHKPGVKFPPEFTVLALYAPFGGNTPTEYLFDAAAHDTNTYAVLGGQDHDIAMLRASGDIVVNLISDADQAAAVLPDAVVLADVLAKTIVNHPREILQTTRERVAGRLAGLPHVRVPRSVRVDAGSPHAPEDIAPLLPSPLPVLARPAGTHGGDDFEHIADLAALSAFIDHHAGADHYLIEYLDYQSTDGYFRKYRFIFVDGEILPYHLAIGDTWKVHHVNTDMINHRWMQEEEEAFLADPHTVFSPENYEGLRAIRNAFDLQYFGIDCGRDRDGALVVFEVNASMLVHQKNEDMPYKDPYVAKIKAAFDRMLLGLAKGAREHAA